MLKQQLKALSNSRVICTSIPLLLLQHTRKKSLSALQDYCLRARFALTRTAAANLSSLAREGALRRATSAAPRAGAPIRGRHRHNYTKKPRISPKMMGVPLLVLPSFVLVVFALYWSLPLAVLGFSLKPWNLWGTRNDSYDW
jgi:hypothetical protein